MIDQTLEILFVGRPGAVGKTTADRDGNNIRNRRCRGRLRAGDLVDAVIHHDHGEIFRRQCCDGRQAAQLHQQRAVSLKRENAALRLGQCDAERDREGEAHAAQHIEILRAVAGCPQIEIGIANAADHGFLVVQPCDQPRGEIEPVHHLGVAGRGVCFHAHMIAHLSKTLPPVKSGDRISATGACVVMACLIDRSTMNSNSSIRVAV